MNNHRHAQPLLSRVKNIKNKGFTTIDMLAHVFVIVILIMALPIFLTPSPLGSGIGSPSRPILLLR